MSKKNSIIYSGTNDYNIQTKNDILDIFIKKYGQYILNINDFINQITYLHDNYPPHNIEEINNRISVLTIAIAGFLPQNIEINLSYNYIEIVGTKLDDNNISYTHKGIASRAFTKKIILFAPYSITNVEYYFGLLKITLEKADCLQYLKKNIKVGEIITANKENNI